jgi:soluble cytochrome b562
MRQLSTQIDDPTKQSDNLTLLETLHKAVEASKSLEPKKTVTLPPSDRPAFLAAYREQMEKLETALSAVGESLKSGQYEKAKALLATTGPIKKEGHSRFKQD